MSVWAVTISNDLNCYAHAYANRDACIDDLYDYPDVNMKECPDYKELAIQLYFNYHPDGEKSNIQKLTVYEEFDSGK